MKPNNKELKGYLNAEKIMDAYHNIAKLCIAKPKSYTFYKTHNEERGCNFVYLLKDKKEVVYVGKTTQAKRPWEHTDKKWDEVELIEIPLDVNLNIAEMLYIKLHSPKYNMGNPFPEEIMNCALEVMMTTYEEKI
jgi:hypothetical protein